MKAVEDFVMDMSLMGYSENTIKNYKNTVENFFKYINKEYKKVKDEDIKKYMFNLQKEKNLSLKSLYRHLSAIKCFYSTKKMKTADSIKLPKISKNLPVFLNYGEIKALLNSSENLRDRVIMQLLYATGLRVSELCNLNIKDIEEDKIFVHLGKGAKDRVVFIDENTRKLVNKYIKTRKKNGEALIINKDGERISQRSIQSIIKKYAKKAKINKKITPHTLRHTFATHLLQNDADIVVIKDLLGHSNLSTTQIYTHVTNKYKEEVYKKSHPLSKKGISK
ncbi:recombinase XerC [Thermococci archaeon]|nr:MAG: recombinase XerC [Thermococci archaeon]